VIILLVIYYFGTYSNKKREKELRKLQDNLKEGDKIITVSGISGVIDKILEDRVIIKTYPDFTKITIEKWSIASLDDREN
jgi:preprotein translocase subunit YajC